MDQGRLLDVSPSPIGIPGRQQHFLDLPGELGQVVRMLKEPVAPAMEHVPRTWESRLYPLEIRIHPLLAASAAAFFPHSK